MFEGYLERGGFALLAERDGELVGYAVVGIAPASDTLLPDTWQTGARVAEIESLSIAIRLYERRGFRPAWLYMFRLGGRSILGEGDD